MKVIKKGSKIFIEFDSQELVDGENIFIKNNPANSRLENKYKYLTKPTTDFLKWLKTKYGEKEIVLKNKDVISASFDCKVRDYMAIIRREIANGNIEIVRISPTKKIISVRFL